MATRFRQGPEPRGSFTILLTGHDDEATITYTLSNERAEAAVEAGADYEPHQCNTALLHVAPCQDRVVLLPKNTLPGDRNFLQPKYRQLKAIILEDFDYFPFGPPNWEGEDEVWEFLEALPTGFVRDPEYGLGLLKELDRVVAAIEAVPGVTTLVLRKGGTSALLGDTYVLSYREFEALRLGLGRIHRRALMDARLDKAILTHNTLLTARDPVRFPERSRPYRPDAIFRTISATALKGAAVSVDDGLAAIKVVAAARKPLAEAAQPALLELQHQIELLTLEDLIAKMRDLLDKRLSEDVWQAFFVDNPFVLSLAFGLPIVAVGNQVSVGGRKFSGKGEKVADFLHRNELTDNLVVVEIKTPTTKLFARAYREGVHPPSAELAGAITQVLDQRLQLQKNIAAKKEASRRWDIESYVVKCLVIVGRGPSEDEPDLRKSLELFRNSLADVLVVTYDELAWKLEHLHRFLTAGSSASLGAAP